jgi:hypothetical protein
VVLVWRSTAWLGQYAIFLKSSIRPELLLVELAARRPERKLVSNRKLVFD